MERLLRFGWPSSEPPVERAPALFAAALAAAGVHAQVDLHVIDAADRTPIPFAPVSWTIVGDAHKFARPCDADGTLHLDVNTADLQRGVVVSATFLGYGTRTDTLHNAGSAVLALHARAFALNAMVVTGQYVPTDPGRAVHRVRTIEADRVERMAANSLGDVLRQELGMRMTQDNVLGTSVRMQGLGGENVKVLVDGVPVIGRLNGDLDLSQIDMGGIERIEVVEGPMSVNYGSNALAGTIDLITRKRTNDPASITVASHAEHTGRLNLSAALARHWKAHDLGFTVGRNFFGGWDARQGSDWYDFAPRSADTARVQQWKPREQYFGRFTERWRPNGHWTLGLKSEAMRDLITDRGAPRAPYQETAFDQLFTTERLDHTLHAEASWGRGMRLKAIAAHDRYRRVRSTVLSDLTTLDEVPVTSAGMQDTTRSTLTNLRASIIQARDSSQWCGEAGIDLVLETGSGERIGNGTPERIGDHAAYASAEWRPRSGLTLRPGIRAAYNTRYGAPVVPSFNIRWLVRDHVTARASYARGFRAPSLKELNLYFVDVNHDIVGNPDLRAERSHSVNLSLVMDGEGLTGTWQAELAAFFNRLEDVITLARSEATRYTYVNIGDQRTCGGSVRGTWHRGGWRMDLGAAATMVRDTLGAAIGGAPWLATPELNGSLARTYNTWTIAVFARYQGDQRGYTVLDDASIGRSSVAAFAMVDASLGRQFLSGLLNVRIGCKNLLDVTNLDATIGGTGAHSGPGTSVPMSTGRTYFLRVEFTLKKNGA